MVRDDVLQALKQHCGQMISDGMLAKKRNVSCRNVYSHFSNPYNSSNKTAYHTVTL